MEGDSVKKKSEQMNHMETPVFFSIVIVNYNYGAFLQKAIESVLIQSCQDFELIIVDGGSQDSSCEIIRRYEPKLAWWCSEKDAGQSEAFNKGFARAKGEFLTWLNADDIMLPRTLEKVAESLRRHPEADWATGNFLRFESDSGRIIEASWGPHWVPFALQRNRFPVVSFGPTTFWRRKVFDRIGGIDESLHYTMDVEYWIRLMMAGAKQVRVNHCCWAFRMHETSKTAEFGAHERDLSVKQKMSAEHEYIRNKTGYRCSKAGHFSVRLLRLLDISFLVALWRNRFIVGRMLVDVYGSET